jgi:hypothetical protein
MRSCRGTSASMCVCRLAARVLWRGRNHVAGKAKLAFATSHPQHRP